MKTIREKCIETLRTTRLPKIEGMLVDVQGNGCCALGACAMEVLGLPRRQVWELETSSSVARKLGIVSAGSIYHLNDREGKSFSEIADYLEAHPELFME